MSPSGSPTDDTELRLIDMVRGESTDSLYVDDSSEVVENLSMLFMVGER